MTAEFLTPGMILKRMCQVLARYPGRFGYAAGAPLLKRLCRTGGGRKGVETLLRGGGRALFWAFHGRKQAGPERIRAEWERILRGVGLDPKPWGNGTTACATCFSRCTLDLKPGDERTCDTVMSMNDELIRLLGGRMILDERLVDPGGTRCIVRIRPIERAPCPSPGEREVWCDEATARKHFDRVSGIYDLIMGYFEIPTNARAVRNLSLRKGARVLDLGAGTGLGLLELLRRLPAEGRVVAVDTSEKMLVRSRRRIRARGLSEKVEFLHADAADTGLPSASFDAVYSSFLIDLHTAAKRRAILAEAKRLLDPGGTAIFAVMDGAAVRRRDRLLSGFYSACYGRWNPLWKALFNGYAPHCRPICMKDLFEGAGLSVIRRDRAYVLCFPVAIYIVRHSKGANLDIPMASPFNTAQPGVS